MGSTVSAASPHPTRIPATRTEGRGVIRLNRLQPMFLVLLLSGVIASCSSPATPPLAPLPSGTPLPAPSPSVSLTITHYTPQAGKTWVDYFVSNFSVLLENQQLVYSSARDGLSDTFKTQQNAFYGFLPNSPYSNPGAFFSDLILFQLGITTQLQSALWCPSGFQNSAHDALIYADDRNPNPQPSVFLGLNDCEKSTLQLNPTLVSFSQDGLPDYLKVRCGLNPLSSSQSQLSPAGDGLSNYEKCKRHLPLRENGLSPVSQAYAYDYSKVINPDASYDLQVNNIAILNQGVDNFLAIYIIESDAQKNLSLASAYLLVNQVTTSTALSFPYWGKSVSAQASPPVVGGATSPSPQPSLLPAAAPLTNVRLFP